MQRTLPPYASPIAVAAPGRRALIAPRASSTRASTTGPSRRSSARRTSPTADSKSRPASRSIRTRRTTQRTTAAAPGSGRSSRSASTSARTSTARIGTHVRSLDGALRRAVDAHARHAAAAASRACNSGRRSVVERSHRSVPPVFAVHGLVHCDGTTGDVGAALLGQKGLPVGSHFAGAFAAESLLFSLAAQLERAAPWSDRGPPISVGGPTS
ncbi:protein of unknown function [Paraburkholderia kururiensis]